MGRYQCLPIIPVFILFKTLLGFPVSGRLLPVHPAQLSPQQFPQQILRQHIDDLYLFGHFESGQLLFAVSYDRFFADGLILLQYAISFDLFSVNAVGYAYHPGVCYLRDFQQYLLDLAR